MTADPRTALARLIAAFEAHLRALENAQDTDDDSAVERAYEILAAAYEAYDDALGEIYDESTPLAIDDDLDDDDLDDELDDDEFDEEFDDDDDLDDDDLDDDVLLVDDDA